MSEEVLTATHDVAYWRRRCEQAEQREAITADAYNQQQSSYRELETLYQASQERALRAEGETAALRQALEQLCYGCDNCDMRPSPMWSDAMVLLGRRYDWSRHYLWSLYDESEEEYLAAQGMKAGQ